MRNTVLFILSTCIFISSNRPQIVYKKEGLEVYGLDESKELNQAKLSSFNILTKDDGDMGVHFQPENYELKANSNNNLTGLCANSKDGQHLHLIVDNKPYSALYQTEFSTKEDSGSHLILGFLSRSHHQSVKTKSAYRLVQYDKGNKTKSFNLKKPYLFYSRPKGTYVDNDTKDVLLDFYLVNTLLSPKGNKVKITLDSVHSFTISQWRPYLMRGLSMGDHKVKLSLVNASGKEISTPFLPVERKFSLQQSPK